MPAITTMAISAASSAYSSRSCPTSPHTSRVTPVRIRSMSAPRPQPERGRTNRPAPVPAQDLKRVRDVAKDRVHLDAGGGDAHDGNERDQCHEQRVLEEILAFVTANPGADVRNKRVHHVLRVSVLERVPDVAEDR